MFELQFSKGDVCAAQGVQNFRNPYRMVQVDGDVSRCSVIFCFYPEFLYVRNSLLACLLQYKQVPRAMLRAKTLRAIQRDDSAVVNNAHAVSKDLSLFHVVCCQENCFLFLMKSVDKMPYTVTSFRV